MVPLLLCSSFAALLSWCPISLHSSELTPAPRRYFNETLIEGMDMYPGFFTPSSSLSHKGVLEYLEDSMPPETPAAFGLHPNAEIGFKLREADAFCISLFELQPREAGGEGGMSMEEKVRLYSWLLLRCSTAVAGVDCCVPCCLTVVLYAASCTWVSRAPTFAVLPLLLLLRLPLAP